MTWALIVCAVLGAGYGGVGARLNRVTTGDERALWVGAGLIGGPLALLEYCGVIWLKNLVPGIALPVVPSALALVTVSGALGAALTPAFDESDSPVRWAASIGLKLVRSPIATTAGLLAAVATGLRGRAVDFRRGMLFIDVGPGGGALALGAVAWCQNRCFGTQRCTTDALARHEAVHSRTVAAVGELGFYLTYLTAGVLWARVQGGPWNSLTPQGCGQPFEKTAHTYTSDPAATRRCKRSRVSGASSATTAGREPR
ncbi:MAG: hypothetical protein WD178_01110 [Actinomycetota bacterium]